MDNLDIVSQRWYSTKQSSKKINIFIVDDDLYVDAVAIVDPRFSTPIYPNMRIKVFDNYANHRVLWVTIVTGKSDCVYASTSATIPDDSDMVDCYFAGPSGVPFQTEMGGFLVFAGESFYPEIPPGGYQGRFTLSDAIVYGEILSRHFDWVSVVEIDGFRQAHYIEGRNDVWRAKSCAS